MTLSPLCQQVEEHISEVLDGTASPELQEHLLDCDVCRDLRHEAERAVQLIAPAGSDFTLAPADLRARLETALAPNAAATVPAEPVPPEPIPAAQPEAAPTELTAPPETAETAPKPAAHNIPPKANPILSFLKQRPLAAAIAVSGAAAALLFFVNSAPDQPGVSSWLSSGSSWQGVVRNISQASASAKGLEICTEAGACERAQANHRIRPGSRLKTDSFTRATLRLDDGSELTLDQGTELILNEASRSAQLKLGSIVADIAHQKNGSASFVLDSGKVEVLGTKFALRAQPGFSSVEVSRGAVKLIDNRDRQVTVYSGETGEMNSEDAPRVGSGSLSQALAWSEISENKSETLEVRGLGELRAKKPGTGTELKGAVTLTQHQVKVRISGIMARTEVTEVFTNHTSDVLEGIFRFPLPPDAQIERLALEVDGKLEEGAFVDREKAAKIWKGAIVNANRNVKPPPPDEIIWVPGPWRDPALLEWQRGGRFELRIYPLPRQSSRKVVLTYTQVLKQVGKTRRYVYPLAHDPSGSTHVNDFSVDVEVRGSDARQRIHTLGYPLRQSEHNAAIVFDFAETNFVPRGDLALEYALPSAEREVSVWTYGANPTDRQAPTTGVTRDTQSASDDDARGHTQPASNDGYVALTIRPELPRRTAARQLDFVFVVDASRSMFGEAYGRASALVARAIRELDRADRVNVFACDVKCSALAQQFQKGGAETAQTTATFLRNITPEGASDVTGGIEQALAASQRDRDSGHELRVIYVGDGTPTVGAILPGLIKREAKTLSLKHQANILAVAVGSDSDVSTLGALALGGGGTVLPYTPGRQIAEVAYDVLSASYMASLRDVSVELPGGLYAIAPSEAPPILDGGELLITARSRLSDIRGDVVVRGLYGGSPYEKRYPVNFAVESRPANAFVPRLFAAGAIADLETDGSQAAREQAVRLSQEFNVASRYTSLLVLESTAMFKAFGLDNSRRSPEWSGEEETEDALENEEDGSTEKDKASNPAFDESVLQSGGGSLGTRSAPKKASAASDALDDLGSREKSGPMGRSSQPSSAAPRAANDRAWAAPPAPAPSGAPALRPDAELNTKPQPLRREQPLEFEPRNRPPPPPPRNMIPMRRIWKRSGSIETLQLIPASAQPTRIGEAERDYTYRSEARQPLINLYRLYMIAGDLERASHLAIRWSEKEPLDPEALTATADVAARLGDRDRAIRILGSVLDARPGEFKAQWRLARLYRWGGEARLACRFSLAIAQTRPDNAGSLADAVKCSRELGYSDLGEDLLARAANSVRLQAQARLDQPLLSERLNGDVRLEATWEGGNSDLDLGLLHPDGHRISWLGAPSQEVITSLTPTSTRSESLSLRGAKAGQYVVEVVRAKGSGPVRGVLTLTVGTTTREIPFTLTGSHRTLALAKVSVRSELVPY